MEGAPQRRVGEILGACPSVEETWSWLQGNQRTRSYWAGGEEAPPAVEGLRTSSSSTSSSSARGSGARPMVVPTLPVAPSHVPAALAPAPVVAVDEAEAGGGEGFDSPSSGACSRRIHREVNSEQNIGGPCPCGSC